MIKIDHVVLQTANFSGALQFYRPLFEFTGFKEVLDPGSKSCIGYQQSDGLTIWVEDSEGRTITPKAGSLDHFAFHCESRDEVNRAFGFCKHQGWNILSEPRAYPEYGNFYGFAFQGPDALKLEFVTR